MNYVTQLANKKKPWGYVKFIHRDGKIHEFYSCVNRLNGDRLSAFDNHSPYVNETLKWAKSVFRDIFTRSKGILEFEGNILEK